MNFTKRQSDIIDIIAKNEPVRSFDIANMLGVSQATVRSDLAILTSAGIVDGKPNLGYFYNDKAKGNVSNKFSHLLVKDVMKEAVTVLETSSVYDASLKMILQDVSTLFVVDKEGYLIGLLSRKDLLKSAIQSVDVTKTPVALTMTRQPLHKVTKDVSVMEASKLIVDKEIDGLPVVEEENGKDKLIGRITKTNISEIFVNMIEG